MTVYYHVPLVGYAQTRPSGSHRRSRCWQRRSTKRSEVSLDGGGVLNRGLRRHLRAHVEVEALPWLARDRPVAPASLPTSVSEGPFSMGSPAGTPPAVAAAPAAGPGPYQPPDLNKAHTEAPCNTKSVCRRTPNFRASDSEEVPPVCRMPAPMVGGRGAEKSTEEGLSETRARY